jgi:drug/metabolite transporter (DMT)-like permease
VFGIVVFPFGWVTPTWAHLGLFVASGAISTCALFCVNHSLKLAPASTVVPYQYSMIVWAVMFGYIVFGDVPRPHTALGAAIIIAAGLYIFWRERELGRSEPVINPPA